MQRSIFRLAPAVFAIGLLLAPTALAETVSVGSYDVEYDQSYEADTDGDGYLDKTSYYKGENLVFTAFDSDADGKKDLWFRYDEEAYLDLELSDADGDSRPDETYEFDREENATAVNPSGAFSGFPMYAATLACVLAAALVGLIVWRIKTRKRG